VPFRGETSAVIFEGILSKAPASPVRLNPELPAEFERIIHRALEKDRNLRYQHAADLRAEFQRLKRDTESGRSAIVSAVSESVSPPAAGTSGTATPHSSGAAMPAPASSSSVATVQASGSSAVPPTATPAAPGRRRWLIAAAALVLAALAAGGFFLYGRRANALSEKDFILLTDFTNTTGDSVFDGTLKQALAVQLEQSPFLNVYPQERVRQALRYAGRSPDDRVTVPIARDICQREAVKAILTGSISPLGSNYVVSLEALNCRTGDTIARQQAEAASKEKVLQAVGTAAKEIRGPLGETVTSIEHFSAPIEQATTSSLEAMQAYAMGDEKRAREGDLPSLPFFKHAAELDPNFAMAFARVGAIYANLGELRLAEENGQKAYDLRERTSEREKFYIVAHYLQSVTGEIPKEIENYELWVQTYPRDYPPRNNLAVTYTQTGEFQKALAQALEALRLAPTDVLPYLNVIASYARLNQLEEAKAIYKQAVEKKLDPMGIHSLRFMIAYLEGDAQEMDRQSAWAAGKTQESVILQQASQVAASRGQLKKARDLSQQAFDSAKKFNLQSGAAQVAAVRGVFENWIGDPGAARSWSTQALDLSSDQVVWPAASLAWAGDSARSEKVLDAEGKRHPNDTILQQDWIPQVQAAIEIKRGNPAAAINALKTSALLEANDITPTFYRGMAYLSMKSDKEAAAEFKKVIDRKTIIPLSPLHAISQLQLARSLALSGETGARAAYQDLFAQWKDADPDLPILKQAQAEYAKLP